MLDAAGHDMPLVGIDGQSRHDGRVVAFRAATGKYNLFRISPYKGCHIFPGFADRF